jgi:hypothetical protein
VSTPARAAPDSTRSRAPNTSSASPERSTSRIQPLRVQRIAGIGVKAAFAESRQVQRPSRRHRPRRHDAREPNGSFDASTNNLAI